MRFYKYSINISSQIAQNSASALLAAIICFLILQVTRFPANFVQKLSNHGMEKIKAQILLDSKQEGGNNSWNGRKDLNSK